MRSNNWTLLDKKLAQAKPGETEDRVTRAITEAVGHPRRAPVVCRHTPLARFHTGHALEAEASFENRPNSVLLYYRHVNHAERFESREMELRDNRYRASIPAAYTTTEFPIQYYFEVRYGPDRASLYPGLGPDLTQQPYFVVRRV